MTASWHHPCTVIEWEPEKKLRMIFFSLAGYYSFHGKESMRTRIQPRGVTQGWAGHEEQEKWCLIADCRWGDASRFRVLVGNGKADSLIIWFSSFFIFIFTIELCCKAVGFCDPPLVGRGIEMFTWGLFYLVNLGSFPCIFCETLFHTGKCIQRQFLIFFFLFPQYIGWQNFIFFKSSCFQTPLLRKKSLHPVRLEGISNDGTRALLI